MFFLRLCVSSFFDVVYVLSQVSKNHPNPYDSSLSASFFSLEVERAAFGPRLPAQASVDKMSPIFEAKPFSKALNISTLPHAECVNVQ